MKKTIEITLMSDLCAGVGKHYAAIIDLDTAVDDYGIPYIPSRRLKGCMREVAEMIGIADIDSIFGTSGSCVSGSLSITDAKIEGYDDTVTSIIDYNLSSESVTELFCSVRAETAIENDTVKDKSLRFIRVVNRISPLTKSNLVFRADVEFDDEAEESIVKICKGLRNIGYHRNRGLGAVICRLKDSDFSFELEPYDFESETKYVLDYTVRLKSDLMMPSVDANHSLDYIPGTSVIGALASGYKADGFNELFLSGAVCFSNLYISDQKSSRYIPSPRFLAKVKSPVLEEDKGIKNLIAVSDKTAKQYKPLKKGYICEQLGYTDPKTKIVYHNSLSAQDGGLYTQQCLCSGQYFTGCITAKGSDMCRIYPLFSKGTFSFGRSKTAQYSRCDIVSLKVNPAKETKVQLKAGRTAAYICESDVILTDSNGIFTVALENLIGALPCMSSTVRSETSIGTKVVSGYNSKWNLKKPQIPVICAGSTVVFVAEEDCELPEYITVGCKTNEGFGKIRLVADAQTFTVSSCTAGRKTKPDTGNAVAATIEETKLDDLIVARAISDSRNIRLNSSQIGRVLLMCKESVGLIDFIGRINSIKTPSTRKAVMNCFAEEKLWAVFEDLMADGYFSDKLTKKEDNKEFFWNKFSKYIAISLTVQKYRLRGEKK